jgi:hypothetical protein
MTATGKVVLDVKLSKREQEALEKMLGGKVLEGAKLEVQVVVVVKGKP